MTMEFRKDINGLRAIAMISVILFHYDIHFVRGGFVGVDLFFVISGFLMAKIIIASTADNSYSWQQFLAKRFRRIYPAFVLMIAVTMVWGFFTYLPDDFVDLTSHAISSMLAKSNYAYIQDSGYFAKDAKTNILLHTWSLSLEWQFYLFFALLFPWVSKLTKPKLITVLIVVAALSWSWAMMATKENHVYAFFSFPTRICEFIFGSIAALLRFNTSNKTDSAVGGFAGVLIVLCILFYNENMPFPSWYAAVPAVSIAVILAMEKGSINKCLAAKPLQWIGSMSYSLYLWHWPIYVAFKENTGVSPDWVALVFIFLVTLIISFLSYEIAEKIFRKKSPTRFLLGSFAFSVVFLIGFKVLVMRFDGMPQRLPNYLANVTLALFDKNPRESECFRGQDGQRKTSNNEFLCHFGREDKPESVLLWGDSHANQFQQIVGEVISAEHQSGLVATQAGCPAVVIAPADGSGVDYFSSCRPFNQAVQNMLDTTSTIKTVLLAGDWERYNHAYMLRNIQALITRYQSKGIRFVLMGSIPNPMQDVPRMWAHDQKEKHGAISDLSIAMQNERRLHDDSLDFSTLSHHFPQVVSYIDPFESLCDSQQCWLIKDNHSLFLDTNHLTQTGARRLKPALAAAFKQLG